MSHRITMFAHVNMWMMNDIGAAWDDTAARTISAALREQPGCRSRGPARRRASLTGADEDYDVLVALIGDARLVLIGEASHGTHEFYRERAPETGASPRSAGACRPRCSEAGSTCSDAVIHIDATRALKPLERTAAWDGGELPETFPSAV